MNTLAPIEIPTARLNGMKGNRYMYMGRELRVDYWFTSDDNVSVVTDKGKTINISKEKVEDELDQFMPVGVADSPTTIELRQDSNTLKIVEKALLQSLKDVQEDEKNIAKAKQISSTASTLLSLYNTKVAMSREIRKS